MKKNHFLTRPKYSVLALVACTAILASCAVDGYDDETFSSSVTGQTLASPAADSIAFTANADGSKTTITWPVVFGARGYRCSVYNVTDADNPVALVVDSVVDGTTLVVPRAEENNYSFSIQTLGNTEYGNSDAAEATLVSFNSYLPGFATIPAGTDIGEWIATNTLPEDQGELALDLVEGGHYTLDSSAVFGNAPVTIRTASGNRATITTGEGASFIIKSGFKLKNVVVDAAASTKPLILLNSEPNPATLNTVGTSGYYYIEDAVSLTNTLVENLPDELINNNNTQYVIHSFLIDNSVIHFNTATGHNSSDSYFNMYNAGGGINDFTVRNSTLYNTSENQMRYMLRYSNSFAPKRTGYSAMTVTFSYSTLYNMVPSGQSANYGGYRGAGASATLTLDHNIVVNTSIRQFVRRLLGGDSWSGSTIKVFNANTYFANGENAWGYTDPADLTTGTGEAQYDQSGTILDGDPGFANADGGDFTVSGANQIAAQSGDPRWLK